MSQDGLTERIAPFADPQFYAGQLEVCRTSMASGVLDHLGYYVASDEIFQLDRFRRLAGESAPDLERLREDVIGVGRQFAFFCARADRALAGAAAGALIRVIAQTDEGVIVLNSVVPGQDVVGVRFTRPGESEAAAVLTQRPGIDEADRESSSLVADLRDRLRLGSRDPGGFEHPPEEMPSFVAEELWQTGQTWKEADRLVSALEVGGLHYVTVVDGGRALSSADILVASGLSPFWAQASPAARRAFYQRLAQGLPALMQEAGQTIRPVLGSPLRRLVLDVEQGAIFVYRVPEIGQLLGVTLMQHVVAHADERLALLAEDLVLDSSSAPAHTGH